MCFDNNNIFFFPAINSMIAFSDQVFFLQYFFTRKFSTLSFSLCADQFPLTIFTPSLPTMFHSTFSLFYRPFNSIHVYKRKKLFHRIKKKNSSMVELLWNDNAPRMFLESQFLLYKSSFFFFFFSILKSISFLL